VVHDYLPTELAELYALIIDDAIPEFARLQHAVKQRLA